ncbi:Salt tolerance down-regulator domain containing protein [Elaphomyces granulatus]
MKTFRAREMSPNSIRQVTVGSNPQHSANTGTTPLPSISWSVKSVSKMTTSPRLSVVRPAVATSSRLVATSEDRGSRSSLDPPVQHSIETMPPPVNRKKQKRRQKQAARLAADQPFSDGLMSVDSPTQNGHSSHSRPEHAESDGEDAEHYRRVNGERYHRHPEADPTLYASPRVAALGNAKESDIHEQKPKSKKKKRSKKDLSMDRIWNTSTQEERENIKKFWLELGEDDRRALVKVEKDAVLKKMKEQQKHSCSCTVCGRKRTAIEEELEVLYDAYYEELEQYANTSQGSFENGAPIIPPPRLYQPRVRSLDCHTHIQGQHHPSRGRVQELPDDEELEEDYDDEEDDDEPYSEDELEQDAGRTARADFFAFGNNLTVKDGILTVADDLLKNDGKHFIDMMEQLAERRMQREEDTQYGMAAAHQSLHAGHNHGPLDDEDYDDEEEDDYDSQDEEEYEEDEMDAMTEEQRMEEGRRMFQIFAARMFEQRVLTAYREKVAKQRQEKLLQELVEEQTLVEQRTAKKAREAQKRKDKKRQQKQAKEEERVRREAEKASEEAAARALEEQKLEEQRQKREEQRKKKEAEKKAQEEERLRKEAEKQRRLQEERERQAEVERRQREQKERDKKKREEARRREREEREARDKEQREKRFKEDRERKAQEEQARKEETAAMVINTTLTGASKAEQDARERAKHDGHQSQPNTGLAAKRPSQSGSIPIPPGLHPPQGSSILHSPHFQVATPVVPKAPTPVRPRQPSQQGSHASSPRSQPVGLEPLSSMSPHAGSFSQSSGTSSVASNKGAAPQQPVLHHPQPSAPLSPLGSAGRSHPLTFPTINGLSSHPPPSGMVPPMYPPRGFPASNSITIPPGINGVGRPMQQAGRGFPESAPGLPFSGPPPPLPSAMPVPSAGRPRTHSRQASGSLENQSQTLPIGKPAPIQRPPSIDLLLRQPEIDELSAQLGSSALLDDTDVSFTSNLSQSLPNSSTPAGSFARPGFAGSPLFADPLGTPKQPNFSGSGTWGPQIPFGSPAFPGAPTWGPGTSGGWPNNAFGAGGHHRLTRPVSVRLLVIQACKNLNTMSPTKGPASFHNVSKVLRQVEQLNPSTEPPISLDEILDICDTEGNPQNGGGSFTVNDDGVNGKSVKFSEPDNNSALSSHRGSLVPGDIGSPAPGNPLPMFGGIGAASGPRQFASPPAGF